MMRVSICVLVLGILQCILKSSASESSTHIILFHYIKMKYAEIYYYFTERQSGNRFNIHYLRTDISSPLAMCFNKCISLFICCYILNHCLCPMIVDVFPFSLDEPFLSQGQELPPNNRKPWPMPHKILANYHVV